MTGHQDHPRRGADCDRPRSVGTPDAAFDAGLPILRELEGLVHDAAITADAKAAGGPAVEQAPHDVPAHGGRSGEDAPVDHPDVVSGLDPTTTLPSRSVRISGTPASRAARAVDGAG